MNRNEKILIPILVCAMLVAATTTLLPLQTGGTIHLVLISKLDKMQEIRTLTPTPLDEVADVATLTITSDKPFIIQGLYFDASDMEAGDDIDIEDAQIDGVSFALPADIEFVGLSDDEDPDLIDIVGGWASAGIYPPLACDGEFSIEIDVDAQAVDISVTAIIEVATDATVTATLTT